MMNEEQQARAEAYQIACESMESVASELRRTTSHMECKAPSAAGSLKGIMQKIWDGEPTPGTSANSMEYNGYEDHVLEAARWIYNGQADQLD